jgi:hypothetical protein
MIQTIQNNVEPNYTLGAEKFCYWLQGFFEMTKAETMTLEQVKMVKEHLHLVFTHKIVIPASAPMPSQFQQVSGSGSNTALVAPGTVLTTVC